MTRIIGFYHENCTDGYGAAYVLHTKFGKAVKLVPYMYGDTITGVQEGDNLIFADCSVPPEMAEELLELGANITIVDHHETAKNAYEGSDLAKKYEGRIDLTFDMTKSGTTLAWAKYYGDAVPPEVLLYIEDRDLWNKKLPNCDEVYYGLNAFDWYKDGQLDFSPLALLTNELVSVGRAVLKQNVQFIDAAWKRMGVLRVTDELVCPAVNFGEKSLASDTAAMLIERSRCPVAVVFTIHPDSVNFSIRSDGSVDVSQIALS